MERRGDGEKQHEGAEKNKKLEDLLKGTSLIATDIQPVSECGIPQSPFMTWSNVTAYRCEVGFRRRERGVDMKDRLGIVRWQPNSEDESNIKAQNEDNADGCTHRSTARACRQ